MKRGSLFVAFMLAQAFLLTIISSPLAKETGGDLNVKEINTKGTWVGCDPAAAANVLGYWAGETFDIFRGVDVTTAKNVTEAQVNLLLGDLAYNMGTGNSGETLGYKTGTAIIKTLKDRKVKACYDVRFRWLLNIIPLSAYFDVVEEIANNRPVVLGGAGGRNKFSVFYMHAACVTGYTYEQGFFSSYAVTLHDGYSETPVTVEQKWYTIPIPLPLAPNPTGMITTNLQAPDDPDCPCGIWQVIYKFNGTNNSEMPATFIIYGDKTFAAQDRFSSYSGTWEVLTPAGETNNARIKFTIVVGETSAGTYTARLNEATHELTDGTLYVHATRERGTWNADRYSDNPWDEPPQFVESSQQVRSTTEFLTLKPLLPVDPAGEMQSQ